MYRRRCCDFAGCTGFDMMPCRLCAFHQPCASPQPTHPLHWPHVMPCSLRRHRPPTEVVLVGLPAAMKVPRVQVLLPLPAAVAATPACLHVSLPQGPEARLWPAGAVRGPLRMLRSVRGAARSAEEGRLQWAAATRQSNLQQDEQDVA